MKTDPNQFLKFISKVPQNAKITLIPIVEGGKAPDVKVRIKENLDKIKLTPEEDLKRLQQNKNVGVYAFPDGLCFVDIDRPDLVDLSQFPESFMVKTRNGGFQIYYLNTGIDRNYILKLNGQKIGELRANWQYVVVPGSFVPPNDESFDGATGLYEVIKDMEIRPLDFEAIKKFVEDGHIQEFDKFSGESKNKPRTKRGLLESNEIIDRIVEVVKPYWKQGNRHILALGLGGLFYYSGIDLEKALKIITKICEETNDEELRDRLRAVEDSYIDENTAYKPFFDGFEDLLSKLTEILKVNELWCWVKTEHRKRGV